MLRLYPARQHPLLYISQPHHDGGPIEGIPEAEHLPDGVVVGFFSEAGSNGGTLLLDDSSFVGDGLGCAHIADKLFYCEGESS